MPLSHVVVINDSSQAQGGATGLAVLSAVHLRTRGLKVTFVCGDSGNAPELKASGVDVMAAGSDRLLQQGRGQAFRKGVFNPAMRDYIADIVKKTDSAGTVYHLHGWAQIFSPSIFAGLSSVAKKTYIHAHDMFLACPNGVYMDYRRNEVCTRTPLSASCIVTNCDKRSYSHKLWRLARQRSLFRNFDPEQGWAGILTIHPDMFPRLARAGYPETLMQVVRNPAKPFTTSRISAENNSSFVYVGRLEEDKGVLDLARAAKRVGAKLVCVGDGVLRAQLEREFPQVKITGWLSKDEISHWVKGARALVMPSHHPEPFALVLAEAIGSGLPVAVANTALMSQEIVDSGLGLSFNVFDAEDFDQTLRSFLEMSDSELSEMSQLGWSGPVKLAMEQESWINHLLGLYENVVL